MDELRKQRDEYLRRKTIAKRDGDKMAVRDMQVAISMINVQLRRLTNKQQSL